MASKRPTKLKLREYTADKLARLKSTQGDVMKSTQSQKTPPLYTIALATTASITAEIDAPR